MSDDIGEGGEYASPEQQFRSVQQEDLQKAVLKNLDDFALSLDVERDMQSNPTVMALNRYAKAGYDAAIDEIIELSPHDTVEISRCLVKIKTYVYMRRAFGHILAAGDRAEQALRNESIEALSVGQQQD